MAGFGEGGDPAVEVLESAEKAGRVVASFPFTRDGYIIHRGRGTLAQVAASGDTANPLYEWALEHNEAHYGGVDGAAAPLSSEIADRRHAYGCHDAK